MITFLLTIYEWTLFAVVCIVLYPVALLIFILTAPFDKKRIIQHRFSCFWASLYIWLQPLWKVSWEGKENIKGREAYVLVSNHQSSLDIIVYYGLFKHFKWIAKSLMFKMPLVGWNMSLNNYIPIKRNDSESHIKMMKRAEKTLKSGSSIMIFPEGTRSPDGNIGRFKRGAFILSEITDLPVIPMVIENTYKAVKKDSFWIKKTINMKVKIFEPVHPKDYKSTKEMSEAVKKIISRQLDEWRK